MQCVRGKSRGRGEGRRIKAILYTHIQFIVKGVCLCDPLVSFCCFFSRWSCWRFVQAEKKFTWRAMGAYIGGVIYIYIVSSMGHVFAWSPLVLLLLFVLGGTGLGSSCWRRLDCCLSR